LPVGCRSLSHTTHILHRLLESTTCAASNVTLSQIGHRLDNAFRVGSSPASWPRPAPSLIRCQNLMIGECPLSPLRHLAQLMDIQCGLARVRKRLVAFVCARRAQPGNTVALAGRRCVWMGSTGEGIRRNTRARTPCNARARAKCHACA